MSEPSSQPAVGGVSWEAVAVLRQMSVREKMEYWQALMRVGRLTALADLRAKHPDWSEEQVCAGLARRTAAGENTVPAVITELVTNFFR